MIFNISSGGAAGSAELNFEVVGSTEQPATPEENTIWVNTETEINGYAFSATEPENPVEGMVWFVLGTSDTAPINLLADGNIIMLYPMSCYQYVSGAWVAKTAKTWQNGEWVEWVMHLILNGDVTANTGGWSSPAYGTLTVDGNGVKLNDPGENWAHTMHKTAVDLTPFKTLRFTVDEWKQSWKLYVGIEESYAESGLTGAGSRLANLQITAAGDYSIDISSLAVSGHVTIIIGGDNSYMRVSAMRLE